MIMLLPYDTGISQLCLWVYMELGVTSCFFNMTTKDTASIINFINEVCKNLIPLKKKWTTLPLWIMKT